MNFYINSVFCKFIILYVQDVFKFSLNSGPSVQTCRSFYCFLYRREIFRQFCRQFAIFFAHFHWGNAFHATVPSDLKKINIRDSVMVAFWPISVKIIRETVPSQYFCVVACLQGQSCQMVSFFRFFICKTISPGL